MKVFIILAICGYSSVGSASTTRPRKGSNQNSSGKDMQSSATAQIIGGTVSTITKWPWQVAIYTLCGTYFEFTCGGSLIKADVVLTAAHCVSGSDIRPPSIKVKAGENDLDMKERTEQSLLVEKIILYPAYSGTHSPNYIHDIAILFLKTPANINSETHPVPSLADDYMDYSSSTLCYMTGWGKSDNGNLKQEVPTKLLEAKVYLLSNWDCNQSVYWNGLIQPSQICAYNRNISACLGDSGSPLICKVRQTFVLFGITSWGSQTCNYKPTVFTRISYYNSWIQTALSDADET